MLHFPGSNLPISNHDFKLNKIYTENDLLNEILMLGDICGPVGMKIIKSKLKKF